MKSQQENQTQNIESFFEDIKKIIEIYGDFEKLNEIRSQEVIENDDKFKLHEKQLQAMKHVYVDLTQNVRKFLDKENLYPKIDFKIHDIDFILKNY